MHLPDLVVVRDLRHLLDVLAENPGARIVAGATDVIPFMRAGKWQPRLLVDITRIADLRYCREAAGWFEIGALATHSDLAASPLLRARGTALAEAAASVADPQIRARATVGGNICTASPAADTVPALLILDAELALRSSTGERRLPLRSFLLGPGKTALGPSEVLTSIRFQMPPRDAGTSFLKLGRRQAMAISLVSAAALIRATDGTIGDGRLALGSVAPTVVRCPSAESRLEGATGSPSEFAAAAGRIADSIAPIDDVRASAAYRRVTAITLAERALASAWERARQAS